MLGMNCTPASRPQATGESLVGENATARFPPIGPISVSVSALSFAPTTVSPNQANRRAARSGAGRAVCRPHAACPLREAHAHRAGVPTRAATFSWNGVAPRRWLPRVDVSVMEVG